MLKDGRRNTNPLLRLLVLNRRKLPLPPPLARLRPGLGIQNEIPPAEAARVVSNEAFVMDIMMFRARPEGQEMVQRPRELVSGMRINRLEQSEDNPEIHGQDMQITEDGAVEDGDTDSTKTQYEHFDGRCVFGGEAKGSRVLVVDFMDVLVEGAPVHGAVGPVVPCVF